MNYQKTKGFNLIELMIVVTIIGVLAAIAIPSYRNYIVKASRQAAQTQLMRLASTQEKIYLNSNGYTSSVTTAYNGTSGGGLGVTTGKTEDGKYTIRFSTTDAAVPPQSYTLTAAPVPGSSQDGDGNISISENGQKLWGTATW